MTNEKMLNNLYDILNLLEKSDKQAAETIINSGTKYPNLDDFIHVKLANLILEVREDLYKETAKAGGKSAALSAVKKVIKKAQEIDKGINMCAMENDMQYFCDGVRLIKLAGSDKLPIDIPYNPKHANFGFEGVIPHDTSDELKLPEVQYLKAYIKENKAMNKTTNSYKGKYVKYDFGDGKPAVNAEYLLTIMEALPKARAYMTNGVQAVIKFVTDTESTGLLIPVRKIV